MLLTSPRGVWIRTLASPDRLIHLDTSSSKHPVFADQGNMGAVISLPSAAKFFDLTGAGRSIGVMPIGDNPLCIALSRSGSRAAVGLADGSIVAVETDGARLIRTLRGQESGITCLCFDRDDRILFSGGADGMVRVWALDSGLELCRLLNGGPPVVSLDMDEQSRTLAVLAGGRPMTFDFGRINDLQRLRPLASAAAQSLKDATAAKNPPPTAIAVLHEWYQAIGWSPVTGQQHP
jgi:WD40 repeat protein